jgi:hypothetical protein
MCSRARDSEGIQTGDEKYVRKSPVYLWTLCLAREMKLAATDEEAVSGELWSLVAFGAFNLGFRSQTLLAHQYSTAQLIVLIEPTTSTPVWVLVVDITIERVIGAMSLHIKSMRLMEELSCVRSYGCPFGDAAVTTQSLSMDSMFPFALSPSRIPMAMISAKIAPFQSVTREPEVDRSPTPWASSRWTMKNQRIEAQKTEILLMDTVLRRVLSRSGDWSTQRPTLDEKRIEAKVLTIPLSQRGISAFYVI